MSAVPNPTVPKPNKPTLIPTKIHLLLHRQKSGSPQKVRILGVRISPQRRGNPYFFGTIKNLDLVSLTLVHCFTKEPLIKRRSLFFTFLVNPGW